MAALGPGRSAAASLPALASAGALVGELDVMVGAVTSVACPRLAALTVAAVGKVAGGYAEALAGGTTSLPLLADLSAIQVSIMSCITRAGASLCIISTGSSTP